MCQIQEVIFLHCAECDYLWWSRRYSDATLAGCAARVVIFDDYCFNSAYSLWYCNQCTATILQVLMLIEHIGKILYHNGG